MFGDAGGRRGGFGAGSRFGRAQRQREEAGRVSEGLGARLGAFKSAPTVTTVLQQERMFFEGACDECAPMSKGTLVNVLVKQKGLSIALRPTFWNILWGKGVGIPSVGEERVERSRTMAEFASKLLEIEFVKGILTLETIPDVATFSFTSDVAEVKENVVELLKNMNINPEEKPMDTWSSRIAQFRMMSSISPSGVIYHPGQVEILQRCQRSANPMIFLPFYQYKSDLLLVGAFLEECGIGRARVLLDTEVTDESKWLWKRMRAVSLLPNTVSDLSFAVERYALHMLLKEGENIVFHLQHAKGCGLSSSTLGAFDHFVELVQLGEVEDIQIVPVSIGYEIPPEFSWNSRRAEGISRISFDQPFSLKEFTRIFEERHQREGKANDVNMLEDMSSHILTTAHLQTRIMCTEIVAFILAFDEDAHICQVMSDRFHRIREDIICRKRDVGFSGDSGDALHRGLMLLQEHIQTSSDGSVRAKSDSSRAFLENLAENVVSVYAMEAVVVTSIISLMQLKVPLANLTSTHCTLPAVVRSSILSSSSVLYHFLSERFFLNQPCREMNNFVLDAVDRLGVQEVLEEVREGQEFGGQHLQERLSKRLAKQFDYECGGDDDEVGGGGRPEAKLAIILSQEAVTTVHMLSSLLRTHVTVFSRVISFLLTTNPSNQMVKISYIVENVTKDVIFDKSSAKHFVEHSLTRLESMGVLRKGILDGSEAVILTEEWSDQRLDELYVVARSFVM